MQKAERTQVDGEQRYYSDLTAIDCTDSQDMARQEFAAEADINLLLQRYGVGIPQKPLEYGETDFTLDLQLALEAVQMAKNAYQEMPVELRRRFPSWQTLLNQIQQGKLKFTRKKEDTPKPLIVTPDPKHTA